MGCTDSKDAAPQGIAAFFGKKVTIKSAHGTFLRAHEGSVEGTVVDQQTAAGEWEQWTIEDAGAGKINLKSVHGTYLRAHDGAEAGKAVDMQAAAGEWEKWEAVAQGEQWRLKSAHGTFLRAHEGGAEGAAVDQQTAEAAGDWENWTIAEVVVEGAAAAAEPPQGVKRLIGQKVNLKSVHGTFLRAHEGVEEGKAVDLQTAAGDWEVFVVEPIEGKEGKFSIKSAAHGTYVRAHEGAAEGTKADMQTAVGDWEAWTVEEVEGDVVRFKSAHGTYLRAHEGSAEGTVVDLQTSAGEWEKWTVIQA